MNHQDSLQAAAKRVFLKASDAVRERRAEGVVRAYLEARAELPQDYDGYLNTSVVGARTLLTDFDG